MSKSRAKVVKNIRSRNRATQYDVIKAGRSTNSEIEKIFDTVINSLNDDPKTQSSYHILTNDNPTTKANLTKYNKINPLRKKKNHHYSKTHLYVGSKNTYDDDFDNNNDDDDEETQGIVIIDSKNAEHNFEKKSFVEIDEEFYELIEQSLMGMENRYTNQTPYIVCNKMYTIGLEISVKKFTNHEIGDIIREAVIWSMSVFQRDYNDDIEEVMLYNRNKMLEFLQKGVSDGSGSHYKNIYFDVLHGTNRDRKPDPHNISGRIGTLLIRYDDSATTQDLEDFYDVGIMMANRPYNEERLQLKLERMLEQKSKDDVHKIKLKKRKQLLNMLQIGYEESKNPVIRNAYDIDGSYNYKQIERLEKRARIDAVLDKLKTAQK